MDCSLFITFLNNECTVGSRNNKSIEPGITHFFHSQFVVQSEF